MKRRMKTIIIVSLTLFLIFTITMSALTADTTISALITANRKVLYNGLEQTMYDVNGDQVYPISYNGTTYLPLRAISDMLGVEIEWKGKTNTVYVNANADKNSEYMTLAQDWAASRIPSLEAGQVKLKETLPNTDSNKGRVQFLAARVDMLFYATTYQNYILFHYKSSWLPDNASLVFEVGDLALTDDGWFLDDSPRYLVFTNTQIPEVVGEFRCEFSPNGNSEQFYKDLDLWISRGFQE